jgi:hypothetical protein
MLLHKHLSLRRRDSELAEIANETPSAAALLPQGAMVTRRKNLRLWVSLRQLQREPR